jgi:hypothetical protein
LSGQCRRASFVKAAYLHFKAKRLSGSHPGMSLCETTHGNETLHKELRIGVYHHFLGEAGICLKKMMPIKVKAQNFEEPCLNEYLDLHRKILFPKMALMSPFVWHPLRQPVSKNSSRWNLLNLTCSLKS